MSILCITTSHFGQDVPRRFILKFRHLNQWLVNPWQSPRYAPTDDGFSERSSSLINGFIDSITKYIVDIHRFELNTRFTPAIVSAPTPAVVTEIKQENSSQTEFPPTPEAVLRGSRYISDRMEGPSVRRVRGPSDKRRMEESSNRIEPSRVVNDADIVGSVDWELDPDWGRTYLAPN